MDTQQQAEYSFITNIMTLQIIVIQIQVTNRLLSYSLTSSMETFLICNSKK